MKREIIKSTYWFLPALLVMIFSGASGISAQTPTSKLKGEISTSVPGGDTVNLKKERVGGLAPVHPNGPDDLGFCCR